MLDFRATKDTYEREEEEAGRLVRPSPKVREPRRDLRRERVKPEKDPDEEENTAETDPDLSHNYKGRSAATRILYRFAKENERVPAWSVEEERVVQISKDTFKKEPGKYKPVEPKDEETPEEPSTAEPNTSNEPEAQAVTPTKEDAEEPHEEVAARLNELIRGGEIDTQKLQNAQKDLPGLEQLAKSHPDIVKQVERDLQEEFGLPSLTLDDLSKALQTHPELTGGSPKAKSEPKPKPKPAEGPTKAPEPVAETPSEGKAETPAEAKPEGDKPSGDDAAVQRLMKRLKTDDKLRTELGLPPSKAPEKKPDERASKLAPEDKKALVEWLKEGPKSKEFKEFIGKQKTVRRTKDDQDLFRDEARGEHVHFEDLPDEQKLKWKKDFEKTTRHQGNLAGLKELSQQPGVDQLLRDLSNPKSDLSQQIAAEGNPAHLDPLKTLPQLEGIDLPEGVHTVADLVSAAQDLYKPPPAPKRSKANPRAQQSADNDLRKVFPQDVAEALIKAQTHPDDIRQMIDTFSAARDQARRMSGTMDFLEKAKKIYQTDPSKISPPSEGLNAKGEEVPWDRLKPAEQAEAMQVHRNKIVAMSAAARAHMTDLVAAGSKAPPALAAKLSEFVLSKSENETPERRNQRAKSMADEMFKATLGSGDEEEVSDADIRHTLKMFGGDPAANILVTGYFQARDYQQARAEFMSGSEDSFSEQNSPEKILQGLKGAMKFLEDRAKVYPKGAALEDVPELFYTRVMKQIRTLEPEKAKVVSEHMSAHRAQEYESAYTKWEKGSKEWEGKNKDVEKKHKKSIKDLDDQYAKKLKGLTYWINKAKKGCPKDKDGKPIYSPRTKKKIDKLEGEDMKRLQAWFEKHKAEYDGVLSKHISQEPVRPTPPPGYSPSRKKKEKGTLWDEIKLAHRVAQRFAFSTCTLSKVMDKDASQDRQSVYWGVAPAPVKPYPEWTQVHQRDIGKKDLDGLLAAAREWLRTPVLSTSVEGIVRDTQLRAALDLAIRSHEEGRYSVGLHPSLYNELLAQLAGKSTSETLLTIQASEESTYTPAGDRTMKPSAEIRAYAAKIASTNPEVAFDLANLSAKVAAQEEAKKDDDKEEKEEDKKDGDKPFPGAAKPFGKEAAQQAYASLRSTCIRVAHENPQIRAALIPILQTIKQIG